MRQRNMLEKIDNGKPIVTSFPVMDEKVQGSMHFMVENLLKRYKRPDLQEIVYSTLKELIINGVKANLKHYIFEREAIHSEQNGEAKAALVELKGMLNEKDLVKFKEVAQMKKLKVRVRVLHSNDKMIFCIQNNTAMTEEEKRRVREKFNKALKYDGIAEYYLENADELEGSGLGITMIVLMLKGSGIDPNTLHIATIRPNVTQAYIELPLNKVSRV